MNMLRVTRERIVMSVLSGALIFAVGMVYNLSDETAGQRAQLYQAQKTAQAKEVETKNRIDQLKAQHIYAGPNVIEDRVINLPEDGNTWHLSLFTHSPESQDDVALRTWFATEPRLATLWNQVHRHVYTDKSGWYNHRWRKYVPELPGVVLQQADGRIVYSRYGGGLPKSAKAIGNQIAAAIEDCPDCRPRPTPQPQPQPVPTPGPVPGPSPLPNGPPVLPKPPEPPPDESPDEGPDVPSSNEGVSTLVLLLLSLLGIPIGWAATSTQKRI